MDASTNRREAGPSAPPPGFPAEAFFKQIPYWHQRWQLFQGVFVPGHNPVEWLCDAAELPLDLSGKRVLDVGAWHGCFSFECERRGAKEVVALSLEDPAAVGFDQLKRVLNSKVEYHRGSVYKLSSQEHGTFDVILFFGVLYHLRYPLLALDRLRSVSRGEVFVETHTIDNHPWLRGPLGWLRWLPGLRSTLRKTPIWRQYRELELHPDDHSNWFGPNVAAVLEAFQSTGFEVAHTRSWNNRSAFRARQVPVPARLLNHTYESCRDNADVVGLA